ncbi:unnamed protein product, partial [Amoebophrya sp. A120]
TTPNRRRGGGREVPTAPGFATMRRVSRRRRAGRYGSCSARAPLPLWRVAGRMAREGRRWSRPSGVAASPGGVGDEAKR